MFKNKYKLLNEKIIPDKNILQEVKNLKYEKKTSNKYILIKATASVFVLLVLFSSLPILASNITPFYELIYSISPVLAQSLIPVNKSCYDNGIKMEVISANINNNTADIYISLQDLEKNRIDKTVDLNDSYSLRGKYSTSSTCSFVEYDESTKTAKFLIHITEYNSKNINKDRLTFSLRNFISNKIEYNDVKFPIDMNNITDNNEFINVDLGGSSGNPPVFSDTAKVLEPTKHIDVNIDNMYVSNYGYTDEKFIIQIATTNKLKNDIHGKISLKGNDNTKILSEYTTSFIQYEGDNRIDYVEYIFDIGKDEISNYGIYGDFISANTYTTGNWAVTFDLNNI